MPTFTDEEIRNAIADGTISAVSLDTNVFDRLGCDLNIATLRKLDQFKDTPVAVLCSEIIVREVKRHISRKAEETRANLVAAIRKHHKRWEAQYDLEELLEKLDIDRDCNEATTKQFEAYVEHIGAEVVPVNGNVDIDELTDRYFGVRPPFEDNAKKKNEFPDALALLSLEAWATPRDAMVLIVSADSGWEKFAEHSDRLVCAGNIETALDHFNQAGRFVADHAVAMLRDGRAVELHSAIDTAIQARLDDNDYMIDADSHLGLDWEQEHAVLQHCEIPEFAQPRIIAANVENVTFSIDLECIVEFCANFHFSVYDSIDKDNVYMGSENITTENTIGLSVVVTITREDEPKSEVSEIQVTTQHINAHFGYVEPDWGYEE